MPIRSPSSPSVSCSAACSPLAQGKHRKAARRLRKEAEAAKAEAQGLRAELEAARAAEPPKLSGLQGQGSATLGNSPALTAVLPPSPPRLLN